MVRTEHQATVQPGGGSGAIPDSIAAQGCNPRRSTSPGRGMTVVTGLLVMGARWAP
jgi:hypothetical protein